MKWKCNYFIDQKTERLILQKEKKKKNHIQYSSYACSNTYRLLKNLRAYSAVVQFKINISVILDICEVEMEQSIPIIISLDVQTEEKLSI